MVHDNYKLVFSWLPKVHLGLHTVLSAKVTQGFLELDRALESIQSNTFEGKGLVT